MLETFLVKIIVVIFFGDKFVTQEFDCVLCNEEKYVTSKIYALDALVSSLRVCSTAHEYNNLMQDVTLKFQD